MNRLKQNSFSRGRIRLITLNLMEQAVGLADNPSVLVTGGSGFVASHLILRLLGAGYKNAGVDAGNRLSFFVADLVNDNGWASAMKDCSFVQHVASPSPSTTPKDENDLIRPARDGTLRVLRYARDAKVKCVVITSSFAAIGYGHGKTPLLFTEDCWSILDGGASVPAYHKSKTLAEKAAWDFTKKEGNDIELVVINPTAVFGPVLSSDFSSSIQIIKNMINGNMPGYPQISFGVVDVRDLADLHIRAMTSPVARGQRFIATCDNGPVAVIEIARILRANRPEHSQTLPAKELPNFLVRILALFHPGLRGIVPELGVIKLIDNTKAKSMLGWRPRSIANCILDTADSLVEHDIV